MMHINHLLCGASVALCLLSACGYKGDLYLPKPNDHNQFGVIQTGVEVMRSSAASAASQPAASSASSEKSTSEQPSMESSEYDQDL